MLNLKLNIFVGKFESLSLQRMTNGKFFNDIRNINWDTMMNIDKRSPFHFVFPMIDIREVLINFNEL